ncbi:MAG: Ig-like domain-containing protein [Methanimicrococcus sp.]|nr:Ig-like domain-containing protein [Methanimicrococcus sp.]
MNHSIMKMNSLKLRSAILLSLAVLLTIIMLTFPALAASTADTIDVGDSVTASGTNWTYSGSVFTVTGDVTITGTTGIGTSSNGNCILVAPGVTADITLDNVIIDVTGISHACAFDMTGATVNLILVGNNILESGESRAGLEVPDGAEVTIDGTGSLTATSTHYGAGIGGANSNYYESKGGIITINNVTITAIGGDGSAGIGGGLNGNGGIITITDSSINASCSLYNGAGIGGGFEGNGGIITIINSDINASGGIWSAGIGGGGYGNGGTITITGGNINASGGDGNGYGGGAGIGGGEEGDGGNILIYGENTKVIAKGGVGVGTAAKHIGAGGGTSPGAPGNIFVALASANLSNGSESIGNEVIFSATPTSSGTVTATLPAPFGTTINLLTGLTASKKMSFITTLETNSVGFELTGYVPITKTGDDLITPSATVPFALPICEIVHADSTTTWYSDIGTAFAAVVSGETIRLLDDINYGSSIIVNNKIVTLETDGFTLEVLTSDLYGLYVSHGKLYLDDSGGGEFNVTSADLYGVGAYASGSDSEVTVTNAAATNSDYGYAVYASDGGVINVLGGASATGDYSRAVWANGTGSTVNVIGDVSTTGTLESCVHAEDGGTVTIDGTITAGGTYIGLESGTPIYKTAAEFTNPPVPAKTGYRTYTDDGTNVVYVKGTAPTISGGATSNTDTIDLTEGYTAGNTKTYTIGGDFATTGIATDMSVTGITDATVTSAGLLTIPTGLTAAGSPYQAVITASNGVSPNAVMTVTVTVVPPPLTGTVSIDGTPAYGETLTANTSGINVVSGVSLGTLSYQWKRGTVDIGTDSNQYTVTAADIGQTITVTVTAANYLGSLTSASTPTVAKATTTGIPQTIDVDAGLADDYNIDLTTLLPNISPLTFGTVTYSPAITTNSDGLLDALSYTSGTTLVLPVQNVAGAGNTATVTVTISSDHYNDFTAIITVDSVAVPVISLTVTDAGGAATVTRGDTLQMSTSILPAHATDSTVTWTVTNVTGGATIDAAGLLTALKEGTVMVTATANDGSGITDTFQITINRAAGGGGSGFGYATIVPSILRLESNNGTSPDGSVTGVTLDKVNTTLNVSEILQLIATITPGNAENTDMKWSSSDSSIASVDESGKVTAHEAGTVTITVTTDDGDFVASCTVTISDMSTAPPTVENRNSIPGFAILTSVLGLLCALVLFKWRQIRKQ